MSKSGSDPLLFVGGRARAEISNGDSVQCAGLSHRIPSPAEIEGRRSSIRLANPPLFWFASHSISWLRPPVSNEATVLSGRADQITAPSPCSSERRALFSAGLVRWFSVSPVLLHGSRSDRTSGAPWSRFATMSRTGCRFVMTGQTETSPLVEKCQRSVERQSSCVVASCHKAQEREPSKR